MAGGRDLTRRSPRWLNSLICSCGLTGIICFFWRLAASDSDGSEAFLGTTGLVSRLIAVAVLPALLVLTSLSRATRRLLRVGEERTPSRTPAARLSTAGLAASSPAVLANPTSREARPALEEPLPTRKIAA